MIGTHGDLVTALGLAVHDDTQHVVYEVDRRFVGGW